MEVNLFTFGDGPGTSFYANLTEAVQLEQVVKASSEGLIQMEIDKKPEAILCSKCLQIVFPK